MSGEINKKAVGCASLYSEQMKRLHLQYDWNIKCNKLEC